MRTLKFLIRALPLLIVALMAIVSARTALTAGVGREGKTLDVLTYRSHLYLVVTQDDPLFGDVDYAGIAPEAVARRFTQWRPALATRDHTLLGVSFRSFHYVEKQGVNTSSYQLILPYWLLGLLASTPLMPLVWRRARRRQRIRDGLCGQCGYDLRHTVDRCPECGNAIPGATPTVPTVS